MVKADNVVPSLNYLESEITELTQKIQKADRQINELTQKIEFYESLNKCLELSLQESYNIAADIENKASILAQSILAEAEAIAADRGVEIRKIKQEIFLLQEELETYNGVTSKEEAKDSVKKNTAEPPFQEISIGQVEMDSELLPIQEEKKNCTDFTYDMKLISFINARHFVSFGEKAGPVHAHSWQVEFEVEVPCEITDTIEYTKIFKIITEALGIYENTILNYVYPFNLIQPITENIAMYFYNRVNEVLNESGLGLNRLNLWETPTRGIQVTHYNSQLDEIIQTANLDLDLQTAQEQAAAALEAEQNEAIGLTEEEERVKPPPRILPHISPGPLRPPYSLWQYLIAIILLSLLAVFFYQNILWPPIEQHYPWGSDTWGHLFKGENLYQEIIKGNYYPQFTEYWYNGSQPFRYWAPLPYYLLALLRALSGDIFVAGNLYVFLCALLGAGSWLFLSRRMGIWPAFMCGFIWLIWQDNVRVAFSEGNFPRILATALLPLLFALFLYISTKHWSYIGIIITVLLLHLLVLCHAMITAVYVICLVLFAFFLWVFQGSRLEDFVRGVLVLLLGIATASWWLLPSLTGGITGIDAHAVKEAIPFIPALTSLNPVYRFSNLETYYWGLSLIIALLVGLITWKSRPAWAKSALVCGIVLVLISFPLARAVYTVLPLSHLLWPLRFSSFAALAILAGSFTLTAPEQRQSWFKSPYISGLLMLILGVLLIFDSWFSFRMLAHTSAKPFDIIQSVNLIKQKPGWRVATIDLSQLGSAPSYVFSEIAGLEQVFGWAWQGAVTSKNIMLLNTGLEKQFYPFLFRSCVDLGATDLVVKEDIVTDLNGFYDAAKQAGYTQLNKVAGLSIWKSVDYPYMVEKKSRCLVVGKYAGTIALQFPEVEMSLSPYIDQYKLEDLREYSMIILSGFTWKSKSAAESLISDYAGLGGQVFIEMAGMPENVLAKQPEFLGVFGEVVNIRDKIEVWGERQNFTMAPVWQKDPKWRAFVPMGLDKVELEFSYYGNQAPILGYKLIQGQKVWFLGNNLAYHAFQTGNMGSLKSLKDILGLNTSYETGSLIPLEAYEASEKGYRMRYRMDRDFEAVLPISAIDGIQVKLDGNSLEKGNFENLLQLKLPAGNHSLEISLEKTPIYKWGQGFSLLAVLLLGLGYFYLRKTGDPSENLD